MVILRLTEKNIMNIQAQKIKMYVVTNNRFWFFTVVPIFSIRNRKLHEFAIRWYFIYWSE